MTGTSWLFGLSFSLLLAPMLSGDAALSFTATVSVRFAAPGSPVNRKVLGNNIQWADRGDGILQILQNGTLNFTPALVDGALSLGTSVLRYPGGTYADLYHWRDGVGPIAQRGADFNLAFQRNPVLMGTQEFLEFCEVIGATPLITVNVITGTPDEAAAWVALTNKTRLTSSKTGRPLPKVRYWEIGNEPYLQTEGHPELWVPPDEFAKRANQFVGAMRKVDPTISVGIPLRTDTLNGIPITQYPGYNKTLLDALRVSFDFASIHTAYLPIIYPDAFTKEQLYLATMAASQTVEDDMEATRQTLAAYPQLGMPQLAFTEYNAIYSLGKPTDRYITTLAGALYVADVLRVFAEAGDLLTADFWSLSQNYFFGAFDYANAPRPAALVFGAYNTLLRGRVIPAAVESPTFDSPAVGFTPAHTGVPRIAALTTREGHWLRVVILNKDTSAPADLTLAVDTPQQIVSVNTKSLGGDGYFDPGEGSSIKIRLGQLSAASFPLRFSIDPHSLFLLEIELSNGARPSLAQGGIVDAASGAAVLTPGAWATAYGSSLSVSARSWLDVDFLGYQMPTSLDGTMVLVNRVAAPVEYIGPHQVNFQVPSSTVPGTAEVQVLNPDGASELIKVDVQDLAPAFFLWTARGRSYVAAVHADGSVVGDPAVLGIPLAKPARPGEIISLYGSGFGTTNPPISSGEIFSGQAPLVHADRLSIWIGRVKATVQYAGLSAAGLYQFNVVVPDVADGDNQLTAGMGALNTQENTYVTVAK